MDCEAYHLMPKKVIDKRYVNMRKDACRAPLEITMQMENGDAYPYRRTKKIRSQGMRKSEKAFRELLKDQGAFYTPDALVKKMRGLLPDRVDSVYDPTCGDGGLLACFDGPRYGCEIDPVEAEKARQAGVIVMTGDTLEEDPFDGTKFRAIIANPTFSVSWNPDAHKEDPLFAGWPNLPPKSKADYAFIAHILSRLADDGTAVVMAYPGILYRGNAEGAIREYLARRGCFERIEMIPGGSFDDTSITTVIITLRKVQGVHVRRRRPAGRRHDRGHGGKRV